MDKNWLETMSKSALFKGIAEEALPAVFNCLNPKIADFNKNDLIAITDEKFGGVGFVLEGEVSVVKENFVGNRIIIAVLKAGEMFGEIIAFTGYDFWPATVIARADSRIMFIQPEKILDLCGTMSPYDRILIGNFTKSISLKAYTLNRKVEYLAVKSMKGKISKYLLEQHKKSGNLTFMLPLKRGELADFLNVSRPTLSREFCKMRDDHIIEFHQESVRILNLEELKAMLE
ncbi:MAG: Crp/Fnr family transcriptional regulator [Chloroflexota bacterium]|nr:Crp/Fnr family transcriptional regulator [Chloroflexota bacterium]